MEKIEKIMNFKNGKYKEKHPILTLMISEHEETRPDIKFVKENLKAIMKIT